VISLVCVKQSAHQMVEVVWKCRLVFRETHRGFPLANRRHRISSAELTETTGLTQVSNKISPFDDDIARWKSPATKRDYLI